MAHCEHRTPDGHCSHLIMADRGKMSGTTQCPFPEAATRACVLNGKVEDRIWSGDYDNERRKLSLARTPQDRADALQALRELAVPLAVANFRASQIVTRDDDGSFYDFLSRQHQFRRIGRGRPTCDLFDVWTVDTCVEPKLNCRDCPVGLKYLELLRERRPEAMRSNQSPIALMNAARVDAIEAYFSRRA